MSPPAEQLDAHLARFAKAHPAEGRNLSALVAGSPELRKLLTQSVENGHLDGGFQPLSAEQRAQGVIGAYRSSTEQMLVPMDLLRSADAKPENANAVLATLGHEAAHAIHKDRIDAGYDRFDRDVATVAGNPAPRDYTAAIKTSLDSSREREATDEIGGVNVLAAKVRRENPGASRQQLYKKLYESTEEVQPYFKTSGTGTRTTYTPKPDITFNKNFQIEPTPANIKAFGQHFFDERGYPADYGQRRINQVGLTELGARLKDGPGAPPARIDLKALGIRAEDVTLPAGIGPSPTRPSPRLSPTAENLLRDSELHVRATAERHALPWDTGMDNTVHAVAASAREAGLTGITHFHAGGGRLRLAQYDGCRLQETELDARTAANTPVDQSIHRLTAWDQKPTQSQAAPGIEHPLRTLEPERALAR